MRDEPGLRIFLPASRLRGLSRALLAGMLSAIGVVVTVSVFPDLNLWASGATNRVVDWAIALIALPAPLISLFALWRAIRWLSLSLWPGPVGITATPEGIQTRLGLIESRTYDAKRLVIRYPFELAEELDEGSFEAYLPEEKQLETLMPRLTHPEARRPIQEILMQFGSGDEGDLARRLRPLIERWRHAS